MSTSLSFYVPIRRALSNENDKSIKQCFTKHLQHLKLNKQRNNENTKQTKKGGKVGDKNMGDVR